MRILIVKTSSMGDVVHALPAVSDRVRPAPMDPVAVIPPVGSVLRPMSRVAVSAPATTAPLSVVPPASGGDDDEGEDEEEDD